jgi:TetR/AcrR family transcriptional regulator
MTSTAPVTRMKAEDRRELILEAATRVFGGTGYVGTTTDEIAKAAGVSQPYVVRMFGTKQKLFLEVMERALETLLTTFRDALSDTTDENLGHRLGIAYAQMSAGNSGLLLSLMHAFVLGGEPEIGSAARRGFLEVYTFLREEAGFEAEHATQFLAYGMLMNTLIGVHMGAAYASDSVAKELMDTAFPTKIEVLLDQSK